MKERLKNDLLLLFSQYLDANTLRVIDTRIDMVLSNYEIEEPHTQLALTEQYETNITMEEMMSNMQKEIEELKAKLA